MELSKYQRWVLSNQYKILEALYPEDAKHYAQARDALESGYELHYGWMTEYIYDGDDVMSSEECREVIDILAMFSAIKSSYAALKDKSGIETYRVNFNGFDGNNDTKQMGYARYFTEHDGGRFSDLKTGEHDDFNSHMPSLERYRAMVEEWQKLDKAHQLTKDEVISITSVDRF